MRIQRSYLIQRGQALLVVILIMVVALTIGLSVATRSITNQRTSTEEENSKRAFAAAEAGVTQALRTDSNISAPLSLGNNAQIKNVQVTTLDGSSVLLNNGAAVSPDDGVDIWLADHDKTTGSINFATARSGTVAIFFGDCTNGGCPTDLCQFPAIEAIAIYTTTLGDISTARSQHYVFDPCAQRAATNHFSNMNPNSGLYAAFGPGPFGDARIGVTKTLRYDFYITNLTNVIFIRVLPYYASTPIGVQYTGPQTTLPSQGTIIKSTGSFDTTQRRIQAFKNYPKLPVEFFPNIVFSSN